MDDDTVRDQINQMVKFIKKEAEEKANEVNTKTEEEFEREKLHLLEAEKIKIRKQYEQKEKQVEVQKKIAYSNSLNQSRLKVLKARDDAVQGVLAEARSLLSNMVKSADYPTVVKDLIVQGLIRLREGEVDVFCLQEDQSIVNGQIKAAADEYKSKTGQAVKLNVVNGSWLPSARQNPNVPNGVTGGVVLSTRQGSIFCSNTLESRLDLVFEQKLPEIRTTLYGRSKNRKYLQ